MKLKQTLIAMALSLIVTSVYADVNVGVVLSTTGPAASMGIPEKNTLSILPKTIGGEKVNYIFLDDATDTTTAVKNMRKLMAENNVDIVIGSTVTPNTLAMTDIAAETKTPLISVAASALMVEPVEGNKRWVFKTPQNDALMATALVAHMQKNNIKTVAFIGFADAYGEGWHNEFVKAAEKVGIKVVTDERFNRTDTSVTGQVLKIMAAKPDAVLIGAAGTPAAVPQKALVQRGFKGMYYQTHGVANNDFLRIGGKDIEGTFLPAGPVLVSSQLPSSNPVKQSASEYVSQYEKAFGPGSVTTFGAHLWDAGKLIEAAIPKALTHGKPGTPEFRSALRDAIESTHEVPGAHGIFNMSDKDHAGLDGRASVMVKIHNGTWTLVE